MGAAIETAFEKQALFEEVMDTPNTLLGHD